MYLFDPVRVNVLGEYGGIGLAVENHLWWNKRNWGYVQFKNSDEVTAEYVKYAKELKAMVPKFLRRCLHANHGRGRRGERPYDLRP